MRVGWEGKDGWRFFVWEGAVSVCVCKAVQDDRDNDWTPNLERLTVW